MSSPPFFLRDSRASETRASMKITPREKRRFFSLPAACRLFLRGVIFTCSRVSLALLSLRKNGGLLVVYPFKSKEMSISPMAETLWFLGKYSIFAICLQRWCEQRNLRNYVWRCFREERWAVKRLFRFCSRVWKYLLSKGFISLYIWVK